MTPEETYQCCKKLMDRKKELEIQTNDNEADVQIVLDEEFRLLRETKPVIYRNLVTGKITLKQFKQFAESAQCVMTQLHGPSSKKPPNPVIFN